MKEETFNIIFMYAAASRPVLHGILICQNELTLYRMSGDVSRVEVVGPDGTERILWEQTVPRLHTD